MSEATDSADVLVGVPVYGGATVVAETLRSIQEQSYRRLRVLISIDNGDTESARACEPFLDDARFSMVVHDQRLGWQGNFNWLLGRADLPFYCYWQQDDITDVHFVERLRGALLADPDAAIAHADVQWFGARTDRQTAPSITGDPAGRVREHLLRLNHVPLLGMYRTGLVDPATAALAETPEESSQQEFVFLARMAAAGSFQRVPDVLYKKRAAVSSTHLRFQTLPESRRRREWMRMGHGLLDVATSVHPRRRWSDLAEFVAERLAVKLPDRDYFYLPAPLDREISRFVTEFLVGSSVPDLAAPRRRNRYLRRSPHAAVRAGVEAAVTARRVLADMERSLQSAGAATIGFSEDEVGAVLLGQGWSISEQGGTWSHSDEATVLIPPLPAGRWRLQLVGALRPAPEGAPPQTIGWALGLDEPRPELANASAGAVLDVTVDATPGNDGGVLRLAFPDAASPASLGLSEDPRHLGMLLRTLSITQLP